MSQPLKVTYMLMAQDPERAQRFYRDALSAAIVWSDPDGSWTVMEVDGREVCLHGNGTGAVVDTGLAIEVEDLEQACAAIERAGGRILRPASESPSDDGSDVGDWLAIATDTEGNRFCVVRHGGCFLHPSLFPEAASSTVN
jgi:predicted enzyme related to lactoylglutathione lyase